MPFGRRSKPRVDPETGELRDQPRPVGRSGERKESELMSRIKDAARDAVVRRTSTKP